MKRHASQVPFVDNRGKARRKVRFEYEELSHGCRKRNEVFAPGFTRENQGAKYEY
jgi:hypothetical protein